MGLKSFLMGDDSAQKAAGELASATATGAYLTPSQFTGAGGATGGFGTPTEGGLGTEPRVYQTQAGTTTDAGFTSPSGERLVRTEDGAIRYSSGRKYKGDVVLDAAGQPMSRDQFGARVGSLAPAQQVYGDIGDLDPVRAQLLSQIQSQQGVGQMTDPTQMQQAAAYAQQMGLGGIPQQSNVAALFGAENQALGSGSSSLLRSGEDVLGGLRGAFETASGQALGEATQGFQSAADQRLALLREQAAPQEARAYDALQAKLFAQGRLGSTGGSRNIEAFGRGMGEADLSRQMQAAEFAEQLRQNAAGRAGAFGQQTSGLQGLSQNVQSQRIQDALAQFGFGADINQQQFGQRTAIGDRMRDLGQQGFANEAEMFKALEQAGLARQGMQQDVQSSQLRDILGLSDEARKNFATALAASQAKQGASANVAQLFGQQYANTPVSGGALGPIMQGFGAAVGTGGVSSLWQ